MKYKVGDIVFATARQPMPVSMERELLRPQVIKEADHPFYEFESGWSVNVDLGDDLYLKRNMNVVFGGSGFLAEALVPRLEGGVLLVARNEGKLVEMKEKFPHVEILTGDISDEWVVKKAMRGARRVFNLAASKHVGIAEKDVQSCVKSNVVGMMNILKESYETRPEFAVFISTDKAAQVSGVYGATKLLGERLMSEAQRINTETKYRTVRYGNVIKSTGSFLTKWEDRMKKGAEVIITDPKATRFFWSREEAVSLIFDCIDKAPDEKPWIPKMKAISLEKALEACQNKWGSESRIKVIGLQEGENLRETMGDGVYSDEVEQYSVEEFEKFL